jgi:hypothetical protein
MSVLKIGQDHSRPLGCSKSRPLQSEEFMIGKDLEPAQSQAPAPGQTPFWTSRSIWCYKKLPQDYRKGRWQRISFEEEKGLFWRSGRRTWPSSFRWSHTIPRRWGRSDSERCSHRVPPVSLTPYWGIQIWSGLRPHAEFRNGGYNAYTDGVIRTRSGHTILSIVEVKRMMRDGNRERISYQCKKPLRLLASYTRSLLRLFQSSTER